MDVLWMTYGLARSLLIYYGRPFRTRQLKKLYGNFVSAGDLCFDVGAHVGSHLRALDQLGAQVVAVEPQPLFFDFLKFVYQRRRSVTLLPLAVGHTKGEVEMLVSRMTPTVTTLSAEWVSKVRHTRSFKEVRWDRKHKVQMTTLDELIALYGQPNFCKIDVEGYEFEVLSGLSMPLPALSFEFIPEVIQVAEECIKRLCQLGHYEFNVSLAETMRFQVSSWMDANKMLAWLSTLPGYVTSGDIYARLKENDAMRVVEP